MLFTYEENIPFRFFSLAKIFYLASWESVWLLLVYKNNAKHDRDDEIPVFQPVVKSHGNQC